MLIFKINEDLDCHNICGKITKELEKNKELITSKDCVITISIKPVIDSHIEKRRLTYGNNKENNNQND